jgi:long-subunit acyl-CoA synthetase (AMP-forming)
MAEPRALPADEPLTSGARRCSLDELRGQLLRHPQRQLTFYGRDGRPAKKTFEELHADVEALAAELVTTGASSCSILGLAGPNGYDWIVADLALLAIGCVSVAFPEAMLDRDLDELRQRYALDGLLVTGRRGSAHRSHPWVGSLDERPVAMDVGRAASQERRFPSDVFSLSFSSGTTGDSKCLMMSKRGIENTMAVSGRAWQVSSTDSIFITMPFSSVQQRTMVYMAIWYGFDVAMAPPERMLRALRELSPTIFIGPPSFFEAVENEYLSTPLYRRLAPAWLARAAGVLLGRSAALRIKRALFAQHHRVFGSRMRLMLVGSAPSRPSMLHLYERLGLPLYQVYGANEFGWITFNLPGANRIGTVGRAVEGVELELAPDGEVIVSGPCPQTLGYAFDDAGLGRAVYLENGRVATGDTGRLGSSGYLTLVGRKKNVIITKGGHKLNPEAIEAVIEQIAAVERAVVFGGEPLSTLVCVVWLGEKAGESSREEVRVEIAALNKGLPAQERIGRLVFGANGELTVESNLLTRNFKIDRKAVFERYEDVIVNGGTGAVVP